MSICAPGGAIGRTSHNFQPDRTAEADIFDRPVFGGDKVGHFTLKKSARGLKPLLQKLLFCLPLTPLGQMILAHFEKSEWGITLENRPEESPPLDEKQKILILPSEGLGPPALLRSPYFRNHLILSFLRGLRLAERHEAVMAPFFLAPAATILWERLRAADSHAVMVFLAHSMRESCPDLWRYVTVMEEGADRHHLHPKDEESSLDLHTLFLSWFGNRTARKDCDARTLYTIDRVLQQVDDPARYRRPLTATALRRYTTKEGDKSYLPVRSDRLNLHDLDPVHAAYLAQIEREQNMIVHGAVTLRDRALATRLFE